MLRLSSIAELRLWAEQAELQGLPVESAARVRVKVKRSRTQMRVDLVRARDQAPNAQARSILTRALERFDREGHS